jgi:NAD(P)H-flavin reductase
MSVEDGTEFPTRLLQRTWRSTKFFSLELERPEAFHFSAGQSIRIQHSAQGRDYSLASGPDAARLELYLRVVESGVLTPYLASAPLGSLLSFSGPHGVFLFLTSPRAAVLVATGTGIAPFLSMIRAGVRGFTILHGVRDAADLYGGEIIRGTAARYVPCVTGRGAAGAYPGRVTGWVREKLEPGSYDFYLCGGREMVRDVIAIVDDRFPDSRVYTEIFY